MGKAGILILVEDEELNEKVRNLNLHRNDNAHLHVTSYIMETRVENIDEISRIVKSISSKYFPMKIKIGGIKVTKLNSARLLLCENMELIKFHRDVLSKLLAFRDKDAPSKAKEYYHEFSEEEKKLIDEYGRSEVMHRYEPHITIGKSNGKIDCDMTKELVFRNVGIYYDKGFGDGWKLMFLV
jgi:hypothetical protein